MPVPRRSRFAASRRSVIWLAVAALDCNASAASRATVRIVPSVGVETDSVALLHRCLTSDQQNAQESRWMLLPKAIGEALQQLRENGAAVAARAHQSAIGESFGNHSWRRRYRVGSISR